MLEKAYDNIYKEVQQKNNDKNYKYKCILSPHECQSLPLIIINPNKSEQFLSPGASIP